MNHYILIHPDGREEDLGHRDELSLEQMQAAVGGYIEYLPLSPRDLRSWKAVVNEDGFRLGLPPNLPAMKKLVWASPFPLVGPVLLYRPVIKREAP